MFNSKKCSPQDVVTSVFQTLRDYHASNSSPLVLPQVPALKSWKLPSPGQIKVNTDAGVRSSVRWGVGAVFRLDQGEIILVVAKELCGLHNPEIVEAIGVCWAIQIAKSHDFQEVEVESDCLNLVQSFINHCDTSLLDMLALDIRDLAAEFSFFSIKHVSRSANRIAHFISKNGCGFPGPICYSGFSSLFLQLSRFFSNSMIWAFGH